MLWRSVYWGVLSANYIGGEIAVEEFSGAVLVQLLTWCLCYLGCWRERERELFFTSAAKSCELFWGHFAIIRQHGWRNATQWEKRRGLNPLQDLNQCHCGLWIIMYYGVGVVNIKIYIWKHRTQSRRQDEDKVHFQNKRHVSVDWP